MKTSIPQLLKNLSLRFLIVGSLFFIALILFIIIADEAVLEKDDLFDLQIHHFFSQHGFPGLTHVMEEASFFGSSTFLLPAYILLVAYFLVRRKYGYAVDIAVIASSSFMLMVVLKHLFHRQRPAMPIVKGITSYSFPSGHSLSSFIFCSILGYIVWHAAIPRVWKSLVIGGLALLTLTIGFSRIVLNVHYTTDVIAGFCFGLMWVILSFWMIRHFLPFSDRHQSKQSI